MPRGEYLRNNYRNGRSQPVVMPRPHAQNKDINGLDKAKKPELSDIWKIHELADYSKNIPPLKNIAIGLGVALLAAGFVAIGYFSTNKDPSLEAVENHSRANVSLTAPDTSKPNFTTYYPVNLPYLMEIQKDSTYFKDGVFGFTINYADEDYIYVTEQNAGDGFNFKNFKKNLERPIDFETFIGRGTIGDLTDSKAAGLKTKDNTLVLFNCYSKDCVNLIQQLSNSLQINNEKSLYKPKS